MVGAELGADVVGNSDGALVGYSDGIPVGAVDVVGTIDGMDVGLSVGPSNFSQ